MERIYVARVCPKCGGTRAIWERPPGPRRSEMIDDAIKKPCNACNQTGFAVEAPKWINPASAQSIRLAIKERCQGDAWNGPGKPCDGYSTRPKGCPACKGTGFNEWANEALSAYLDRHVFYRFVMEERSDNGMCGVFPYQRMILPEARCSVCHGHGLVRPPCQRCLGSLRKLGDYCVLDGTGKEAASKRIEDFPRLSNFLAGHSTTFTRTEFKPLKG